MALSNVCLGSRTRYCQSRYQPTRSAAATVQRQAAVRALTCSSQFHFTSWDDPRQSNCALQQTVPVVQSSAAAAAAAPRRQIVRMGNNATGGPFSPLVVVVRNVMGDKEFNKLRGKAISFHSQIIKDFCKQLGVDNKQVQGVIRLAKKNGEKLGFLA